VLPALPSGSASGVVVLESRVEVGGRNTGEIDLLDLAAGTTITIEDGGVVSLVSPDRTLRAYESAILDAQDNIKARNLIIANATGQPMKVVPWEADWLTILGWTDDRRLVLYRAEPGSRLKYDTYLVLDPFSGRRQILGRSFPKFPESPDTKLPYWEGWYGVLYDPTLTRAISPRLSGANNDELTFGLWDVPKHQLVASLESIFVVPEPYNDIYPMPTWSPDGSQFAFEGAALVSPDFTPYELYSVSRAGKVQQLTHLGASENVQDKVSWSPDGRYIAMFLENIGAPVPQSRVAMLDTTTLKITDYCFPITYGGQGYGMEQPPRAIWSTDSTQFLVYDWYSVDQERVILVDIAKGFAAQIAQDAEPVGWMKASQ
jgi:dipeptidyl aminopeptidase/acylaminoacyl peptidase